MTRLHDSAVALHLVIAAGLAGAAGCGGTPGQEAPAATRPTVVDTAALPPLGPAIGPLDDGRIEIAPPQGWYVPPRSDRWLVRFTASAEAAYPSITVSSEEYQGVFTVTSANWEVLADQIAASVETAGAAARQPMTFKPLEVGPMVGVSYRRRGKAAYGPKEIVVERLLLDTVTAGRRYTFELRTREDDLDRYEPYLLAVAAGVRFSDEVAGFGEKGDSPHLCEAPVGPFRQVGTVPFLPAPPDPIEDDGNRGIESDIGQ